MLKKYAGRLFIIIVAGCIPALLFTVQAMSNSTGKQVAADIVITIQSLPIDKAFLTKEKLQGIGREIIEKFFSEDLAKCGQVISFPPCNVINMNSGTVEPTFPV
jgi:hypothetical protein